MSFVKDFFGSGSGGVFRALFDPGDILGTRASEEAERAAAEQEEAFGQGITEQRRQFDITQANLQPFLQAGVGALGQQQALLGLSGVGAQQAAFDAFRESPGQAFLRERGQRALTRNAASIGGLGGGNVRSALVQQGVGFAQQDFGNFFNRLAGLSGTGQQTGAQLGQFGAQQAGAISNLFGLQGQARASGILGGQQARAQGTQNVLGLGAAFFSDINMKTDINDLDLKECYHAMMNMPLKSWRYLEGLGLDQSIHFGPMVQEAPPAITQGNMINIHDELMMIVGGLQFMKQEGLLNG